jgi:hypothetical protein
MSETDPDELAQQLEREGDELEERSDKLEGGAQEARQDWERKRSDPGVPGANPQEEGDPEEQTEGSPAPQAPPEGAEPSAAETAPEGAVGPPADTDEEEPAERD